MSEPGARNFSLEKKNEGISLEEIKQSIQDTVQGVFHKGTLEDPFPTAREIAGGRVWINGSQTRNETIQKQVREYLRQASDEEIQNLLQQPMEQAYCINYRIEGELVPFQKAEIQNSITLLANAIKANRVE